MHRNQKIIIIGNYPFPYGGVPVLVKSLSKYLSNNNYNVSVVSGGTSGIQKINDNLRIIKPTIIYRLKIMLFKIGFLKKIIKLIPLKSYIKNFKYNLRIITYSLLVNDLTVNNKSTTIICFNLFNYGVIGGIVKKYSPNIKLSVFNFGEIFSLKDHPKTYKKLYQDVVNNIDLKLSMTKHCGNIYQILKNEYDFKTDDSIELIIPGVNLDEFSTGKTLDQLYLSRTELKTLNTNILYVGRITEELGVRFLINAINILFKDQTNKNNLKFTFVGQKAELVDEVLNLKKKFPENIELFLNVTNDFLKSAIKNSDFLVAPSINERACGCLVATEAGALGKTIIAANVGGIPEYVLDNNNGLLFKPNDINDFVNKILKLSTDKVFLKELQQNNFKLVKEKFNMKNFNEKFFKKLKTNQLI
tara:strand:+ start:6373 stop:7620 length:1248 start_codon:yes stop_codon:yes gene_type:complete